MSCIICFFPVEKQYQCSDKRCKELYCEECLESLIDFCHGEKIMLKCPAKDCNTYITLSDLKGISSKSLELYYKSCLDVFLKENGNDLEKELQEIQLLKKYREERQQFLQQSFPEAIGLMASIAFKSKLKRLDTQKSKVLKTIPKMRACMNSTCSGYLNEDLICTICECKFCKQCEKVLTNKHQCKQEDLDCVQFVNQLVKCPGCHLPVFKNQGCNNITCSNCGTNFLYTTGEEGGSGSHNTKLTVNVEQRYKLSKLYKDKIPESCRKYIIELESLEPKMVDKNTMLLPVKKYIDTKDIKMAKSLAIKIDTYYQNKLKLRDYQWCLVQLENMLKSEFSPIEFSQKLDLYISEMK
jgi:hypothetical protein